MSGAPTEVIVSIAARSVESMRQWLASVGDEADAVELRLDALGAGFVEALADETAAALNAVRDLVESAGRPTIAAIHDSEAFGDLSVAPDVRAAALRAASSLGPQFVDVPRALIESASPLETQCPRIVSEHLSEADSTRSESEWAAAFERLERHARPGDRIKLVPAAVSAEACLDFLAALAARPDAVERIGFCSGGAGQFTRFIAGAFGSRAMYACARGATSVTAPGQTDARSLRRAWPSCGLSRSTRIFAVVGSSVAHSLSPAIHDSAQRLSELDAVFTRIESERFDSVFERIRVLREFHGLAVTAPFKVEALRAADRADDRAREIGAANTLVREGDGWDAHNTDSSAVSSLVESLNVDERVRARVFGAGGAARAAAFALRSADVDLEIAARRPAAALKLAREVGGRAVEPTDALSGRDVLIQATPLGGADAPAAMAPHALVDLEELAPRALVIDAAYRACGETPLVLAARARGLHVATGRDWLLAQALEQFAHFHSERTTLGALRAGLDSRLPIVLIGLRGVGKSSVGPLLAARLGVTFIDADTALVEFAVERGAALPDESAGALLHRIGEPEFRELEHACLEALIDCNRRLVIASGGGCVERADNCKLLAESSVAIWLREDPTVLAERIERDAAERPALLGGASAASELEALQLRRDSMYAGCAAARIDGRGRAPEALALEIVARLEASD